MASGTVVIPIYRVLCMEDRFNFSLRREKLSEQVVQKIQSLIVTESLRPGDKLPGERDLAEQLGVSRTVVREATHALGVRGLVKVKPGCGTFVQEPNPKDALAPIELFIKLKKSPHSFSNLYEIRRMVEVEVAGLAAERATDDDFAALDAAIDGMVAHINDPDQYTQYDLAFHALLAEATGNELFSVLLSPISNLWLEVVLVSVHAPGGVEDGVTHHRKILDCIKERDTEKARSAMRDHIRHSQELVDTVRQQKDALRPDQRPVAEPGETAAS